MNDWKPGDVAADGGGNRLMCAERVDGSLVWMNVLGGFYPIDGLIEDARPLVVIDPEDREAVERLASDFLTHAIAQRPTIEAVADTMQAALREFANPKPPKPDEPQGLGAVVEEEDVQYVRVAGDDPAPWARVPAGDWSVECFAWHEIEVVRVLSPGVEVDQ